MRIILISIFIGCLAAFGLGCFGVWMLDKIYLPPQIALAVRIETRNDLENLDLILCDAVKSSCFKKYKRIIVLIDSGLLSDDCRDGLVSTIIEHYNAECMFISNGTNNKQNSGM